MQYADCPPVPAIHPYPTYSMSYVNRLAVHRFVAGVLFSLPVNLDCHNGRVTFVCPRAQPVPLPHPCSLKPPTACDVSFLLFVSFLVVRSFGSFCLKRVCPRLVATAASQGASRAALGKGWRVKARADNFSQDMHDEGPTNCVDGKSNSILNNIYSSPRKPPRLRRLFDGVCTEMPTRSVFSPVASVSACTDPFDNLDLD